MCLLVCVHPRSLFRPPDRTLRSWWVENYSREGEKDGNLFGRERKGDERGKREWNAAGF